METNKTRNQLVESFKRLNRSLANEMMSDSDANAIRRERDQVQAEIEAYDFEVSVQFD